MSQEPWRREHSRNQVNASSMNVDKPEENFLGLSLSLFRHEVVSDSFGTPWTVACQTPLSKGFPRQEYWSGLLFPSSEDLPDPGLEPESLALAVWFFTTEPPAAKLLQSCLTLCEPVDGSPPGSPIPGIFEARVLEWVAIAFSEPPGKPNK